MTNIQEVAKQSGVSISTVSRVLNGTAKVKSDVRKRVEACMQDLAYKPSPAARSLRKNQTRFIGLVLSDLKDSILIELIQGIEEVVQRHEYSLIFCSANGDSQRERKCLDVLCSERVAGIIIVPASDRLEEAQFKRFSDNKIAIKVFDLYQKKDEVENTLYQLGCTAAFELFDQVQTLAIQSYSK
jgi:DNA-binding LacI/PurR family transcriptional regulator